MKREPATWSGNGNSVAAALPAPVVVKLGGRALEAPGASEALAVEIAALTGPALIVHGGGAEVTAWCDRLGLPSRFHDGLRVTDDATLEVVAAVLGGLANKRLTATLLGAGVDAVGLSALDGGLVEATPHAEAAKLGRVGAVRAVHPALIETLLAQGRVPVLASIAAREGRLLNVNADDLAAAIAGALHARALVLLSDTPALVLDGAPVATLGRQALDAAIAHPDVRDGMKPKLIAARAAVDAGVARVHITDWRGPGTLAALFSGAGAGTLIEAAPRAASASEVTHA